MDGYRPYNITLRQTFNAWYLGNILFGGFVGLIIDHITGAIFTLTPDRVYADFDLATGNIGPVADV